MASGLINFGGAMLGAGKAPPAMAPAINIGFPTERDIHFAEIRFYEAQNFVKRSTIFEGLPDKGQINFYKQTHMTGVGLRSDIQEHIGRFQHAVLRQLENDNLKHIFVEGLASTIKPNDPDRSKALCEMSIRSIFPDGKVPSLLSAEQLKGLAKYDAAYVYAVLHPDVTLHRTTTPEFEEQNNAAIDASETDNDDDKIFKAREELARDEINKFLSLNAAEEIGVVFGGDHDSLYGRFSGPKIVEVDHPRLTCLHPFDVGKALINDREPARQLDLILMSPTISDNCIHALENEAVQLAAIEKLRADFEYSTGGVTEFRDRLLNFAVSPAVESKINSLFKRFEENNKNCGPFSCFLTEEISYRIVSAWDPKRQMELVTAAPQVSIDCFGSLCTTEAKLLALRKMSLPVDKISRKDTENYLLKYAEDTAVKDAIRQMFETPSE